jgi:hypothetical protein
MPDCFALSRRAQRRRLLSVGQRGFAATAAVLVLAGWADAPVPRTSPGEAFFAVTGTVTQGALAAAPSVAQEVGVLWLNLLDDNSTVLVEATPADLIGVELPAFPAA